MKNKLFIGALLSLSLTSCGVPSTGLSSSPTSESESSIFSSADKSQESLQSTSFPEEAVIYDVEGATIDQDNLTISMMVDVDTDAVSLADRVHVGSSTIWGLYLDPLGYSEIPTAICAGPDGHLAQGDNIFYIIVRSGSGQKVSVYTLTIYRCFMVTISYFNNDKLFTTEEVLSAQEHELIKEPTIIGYKFYGWTLDSKVVQKVTPYSDLRVDAQATPNVYTVTFDPQGGEVDRKKMQIVFDSEYVLPVPNWYAHIFLGWQLANGGLVQNKGTWSLGEDVTLIAQWRRGPFDIIYDLNGGTNAIGNPSSYTGYDEVPLQNPTWGENVFRGWTLDGVPIDKIEKGTTGDLTLSATWDVIVSGCETVDDQIYVGNPGILSVTINEGVRYIADDMFSYCDNLSSISLPRSLSSLHSRAISHCPSLTSIYIPDGVGDIYEGVLTYCPSLMSIVVDPSNMTYRSEDNCNAILYMMHLVVGCSGSYIHPDTGDIYPEAFACATFSSITIPQSVIVIDYRAFFGCASLETIIFEGTVKQYEKIYKGEQWCEGVLATTVVCSDGECPL